MKLLLKECFWKLLYCNFSRNWINILPFLPIIQQIFLSKNILSIY